MYGKQLRMRDFAELADRWNAARPAATARSNRLILKEANLLNVRWHPFLEATPKSTRQ